ncbi:four helix bundle protein [Roseivirga sp.]|uniref:four helix bundle protein n=1 Tax=Roseivirga sp. TaxID=1964215 RepID=UPI003B517E6A
MKGFRSLIVWQKAHHLALEVYKASESFPKPEQFAVTNQLRRAALSVPTNIAEGSGRKSKKEYAQFLNISMGSIHETEYLLEFSKDLEYIEEPLATAFFEKIEEIKSMLFVLIKNLNS